VVLPLLKSLPLSLVELRQAWPRNVRPGSGTTLLLERTQSHSAEASRFSLRFRSTNNPRIQTRHELSWTLSRHNRHARKIGLALACFALSELILAQEPAPNIQASVIKVQVEQLLVPVVLTDRKGHFITDLKSSDIHVFEDGVQQKLAGLYSEQNGASELFPSDAAAEPQVGASVVLSPLAGNSIPRHTDLIALDTLNSSFGNYGRVRDALKKLFKEDQGSDSQYALKVDVKRKGLMVRA
jgi:hypothetical protein